MNQLPSFVVRALRADEWPKARELRLLALRDPVARIAFLETYERAAAKPDSFWREQAEASANGPRVRQFVAETGDGSWAGTVSVLIEEAGSDTYGGIVAQRQAHVGGVFVRREHRGSGVIDALFEAAVAWAWSVAEVPRVRLYVHEDNARAEGFYRRYGFVRSGETIPMENDPSAVEYEMVLARPDTSPGLT